MAAGVAQGVNFRKLDDKTLTLSTDETTSVADLEAVWRAFNGGEQIDLYIYLFIHIYLPIYLYLYIYVYTLKRRILRLTRDHLRGKPRGGLARLQRR